MTPTPPVSVAILAYPETTASVVYGMYDLFIAAGRDWGVVVDGQPGPALMQPLIVSRHSGAFEAVNGVTIMPHVALDQAPVAEIVCVPEVAVPPEDPPGLKRQL